MSNGPRLREGDEHDCDHRDTCMYGDRDECVQAYMECSMYRPEGTLRILSRYERKGGRDKATFPTESQVIPGSGLPV